MDNAMMVIFPYRKNGVWMFDDAAVGLKQEPFVCGVSEMIDVLVADIKDADKGFAAYFSAQPFPGAQMHLERVREEHGGNWYRLAGTEQEGWLFPAMFQVFLGSTVQSIRQGGTGALTVFQIGCSSWRVC